MMTKLKRGVVFPTVCWLTIQGLGVAFLNPVGAEERTDRQVATLFQSLSVPTVPDEAGIDVHIEPPISVQLNRTAAAAPVASFSREFALGPGDELKVTVWGYPELSEQVVVLPDGTVSYPLVGTLQVRGSTAQQFGESLRQALEPHIDSPRVSVIVTQMRSCSFSVVGDVKKAGVFPLWNDQVNVLNGIAQAEGLSNTALPAEVKIFRAQADGSRQSMSVNLSALVEPSSTAPLPTLQPGDIIYVPGQNTQRRVCVLGEVSSPGLYPISSEMTVIEAMSAAGWIKPSAVLSSVMVVRHGESSEQQFFRINAGRAITKQDWTQHLSIKPGDIVYVPKQFFAKAGDFVSFFTSRVEPAARTYLTVYDASNPANVLVDR